MHALDAIDRKILSLLQSDSRVTMQELADKVGLSVSPCHRRVKLLEERGTMALVDQKSLGLHVGVFISRSSCGGRGGSQPFAKAISKWDEVLECYLMTGNRSTCCASSPPTCVLRNLPEEQADAARRHRLNQISFALSQVKYSIARRCEGTTRSDVIARSAWRSNPVFLCSAGLLRLRSQ